MMKIKNLGVIFFLVVGTALVSGCLEQKGGVKPGGTELDLNEANVIGVGFNREGGEYTFSVTIRHNDTGWDHYVDWWRIKTLEGEEIARRELAHPHVTEQPFTRSLSGIALPKGIGKVVVEAHCSVHEYGGRTMAVEVTTGSS